MRVLLWFLIVLIFFVKQATSYNTNCPDLCTFLYLDTEWVTNTNKEEAEFTRHLYSGSATGIISAEFNTYYHVSTECPVNKVQFISSEAGDFDIPLELTFYKSKMVYVNGFLTGAKTYSGKFDFPLQMGDYFQLSDRDPNFYSVDMGIINNATAMQSLEINYKSNETWEKYQNNNVTLHDTVRIKNGGNCVVFKYISVCPDATPRLCGEPSSVVEAQLGGSYTLTCSASGAPFLAASWIHDGELVTNSRETFVVDKATHRITSQMEIQDFSIDDLGEWTCTIRNKNFGNNVTKTIKYSYLSETTVTQAPSQDYYIPKNELSTPFEWTVEGWPLEQVTLNCHDIKADNITKGSSEYQNNGPPIIKLTLTLQDEDQVLCKVTDGDKVLDTKNITKVGFGCVSGEKGVNKGCEECPQGETSQAGSMECLQAQSQCEKGTYGVEEDCEVCPRGTTSPKNAVKVHECILALSSCEEGSYGSGNDCEVCPKGEISPASSVKIQECVKVESSCRNGEFGYNNNCTKCPIGKISEKLSVKVQECETVISPCKEGEYGTDICHTCPHGSDSPQSTVKIQDCEFKESSCGEGYFGVKENCSLCATGENSHKDAVKAKDCFPNDIMVNPTLGSNEVEDSTNNLPLIVGIGGGLAALLIAVLIVLVILLVRQKGKPSPQQQQDVPLSTNVVEKKKSFRAKKQEVVVATTVNPLYEIHNVADNENTQAASVSLAQKTAAPKEGDVEDDMAEESVYEQMLQSNPKHDAGTSDDTYSTLERPKKKVGRSFSSKGDAIVEIEFTYETLSERVGEVSEMRETKKTKEAVGKDKGKDTETKGKDLAIDTQKDTKDIIIKNHGDIVESDDEGDYEILEDPPQLMKPRDDPSCHGEVPGCPSETVQSATSPIYSQVDKR